ncbi:MAG: shikimate dehydrogenase, partial [Bacteroidetes bacterium]
DFYDIIFNKAVKLAKRLKKFFLELKINVFKDKKKIDLKNYQILINATGVGLKENDSPPITLEEAFSDLVVYDLIYNPPFPSFLKEAKKKKLFTINGLWMLIYQALEAEKIWFGKDFYPEADILYKKLIKELKNAG